MPFGIDDALIWGPLLGAAMGGLMNKKDPLKGALMGGALGAGGGLLAGPAAGGGLLGAAASPASTGLTAAAGGANPLLGAAASGGGMSGALISPSMLTTATGTPAQIAASSSPSMFQQAMDIAKPIGNIASSANSVKGLLSPQQQQQMPSLQPLPVATGQGGAQSLAQIVSGNSNAANQIALDAELRAKRRQQLIGG